MRRRAWRERPLLPQAGYVFLVFTMRAQGPFGHGSRIGPESWRTQPAGEEQPTRDQWPDSYLKESWSLVR